jgi:hypothetical protein
MKSGDKLICRRNFDWFFRTYKEGDCVEITDLDDNVILVKNIIFTFNQNGDYYIWKWFYTPQETRKFKLQELKKL